MAITPIGYPSIAEIATNSESNVAVQLTHAPNCRASWENNVEHQCRALPRCLYRLRHESLVPTTYSMR
jgi:hypothetical protein